MPVQFYPAIIDRSASGYGASFPDFPGCIAAGGTVNEAAVNADLALGFHVERMMQDGDKLPEPSDLALVPREANDVASVLVRIEAPAKVVRVLVSIDENLLRAIDAVAGNRSAWLAEAARAALRDWSSMRAADFAAAAQAAVEHAAVAEAGIAQSIVSSGASVRPRKA